MAMPAWTGSASIDGLAMNQTAAAAESSRRGSQPPRLRFHFVQRIKMLVLINTIPIIVGIGLITGYYQGYVHVVGFEEGTHGLAALVILAACILLGLSWWIIIPVAKWLHDYPRWYFRRESKMLWLLPYCTGMLIYGLTWLACMLAGVIACVGIISCIYVALRGSGADAESVSACFTAVTITVC
jgi:hypothetical protein